MGRERSWLFPAAIMTMILAVIATVGDGSPWPLLTIFPLWLTIGLISFGAIIFGFVLRLMFHGKPHPTRILVAQLKQSTWPLVGFCLAGINMCSFMRVKPLLNNFVPFTADPALAAIDRAILFGYDGAQLLNWLNTDDLAIFYSRAWFAFVIVALTITFFREPSAQKTRVISVYFALWTFAGPVVHLLAPAAGPVFYKDIGFGDHFDYITMSPKLLELRNYLWHSFVTGDAGPGAGISAMPSLHIATTAWAALALRQIWPVATIFFVAFTCVIVALSVALGWHYLIDGIVGVMCVIVLYRIEPYLASIWQKSGTDGGAPKVRLTDLPS